MSNKIMMYYWVDQFPGSYRASSNIFSQSKPCSPSSFSISSRVLTSWGFLWPFPFPGRIYPPNAVLGRWLSRKALAMQTWATEFRCPEPTQMLNSHGSPPTSPTLWRQIQNPWSKSCLVLALGSRFNGKTLAQFMRGEQRRKSSGIDPGSPHT